MLVMSSVLSEMVYGRNFSLFESSVSVFMCFMGRFLPGPISGSFMKDYGIYLAPRRSEWESFETFLHSCHLGYAPSRPCGASKSQSEPTGTTALAFRTGWLVK